MSERTGNLRRAASLLRRMDAIENGPHTYEGVTLHEIARDCVEAANDIVIYETNERIRDMARSEFKCNVDESAGMAEPLNGDSLPSHDFVGESYYCEVCSLPRERAIHKFMADIVDLHDFSRRVS